MVRKERASVEFAKLRLHADPLHPAVELIVACRGVDYLLVFPVLLERVKCRCDVGAVQVFITFRAETHYYVIDCSLARLKRA